VNATAVLRAVGQSAIAAFSPSESKSSCLSFMQLSNNPVHRILDTSKGKRKMSLVRKCAQFRAADCACKPSGVGRRYKPILLSLPQSDRRPNAPKISAPRSNERKVVVDPAFYPGREANTDVCR
jgi:hypothetical protein